MDEEGEAKQHYIDIISDRLLTCNDIELLDLIAIMLEKSKGDRQ